MKDSTSITTSSRASSPGSRSLRGSATLIANPAFKLGSTYTLKTKGYEKTFTLSDLFTAFPHQFGR